MYNLRQQSEGHVTVSDSLRTCRPRTVRSENKALICQIVIQSLRKSTDRLPLGQGVSRWSVQRILHKAKFKHHTPRLTNGLLEDDPDHRIHFCELTSYEVDEDSKVV
jgi:hypothetical protein